MGVKNIREKEKKIVFFKISLSSGMQKQKNYAEKYDIAKRCVQYGNFLFTEMKSKEQTTI